MRYVDAIFLGKKGHTIFERSLTLLCFRVSENTF